MPKSRSRWLLAAFFLYAGSASAATPSLPPAVAVSSEPRIASLLLSQSLINDLLKRSVKSPYLSDMFLSLVPAAGEFVLHGTVKIPATEMAALDIDPDLGAFKFQLAIQPKTSRSGHLILVFPLDETYFWPANAKDPEKERIIVPVQLLSLALASTRGYLAAISGDFTAFDRRERLLKAQIEDISKSLKVEKSSAGVEDLEDQRRSLQLQVDAMPIERRQLQALGKELGQILGAGGEQRNDLNKEIGARGNVLVLRLRLGQLVPYLKDVDLEGVRFVHDDKDGAGMDFLAIDIAAPPGRALPARAPNRAARRPDKKAPDVIIIMDQALLESDDILGAEKSDLGSRLRDFSLAFKEDGLYASGKWHSPLLFDLPFTAILDFVWTAPDQFELRVRDVKVEHLDVTALAQLVLDAARNRLDRSLKGICRFDYGSKESRFTRALRVSVDMPSLIPALPGLELTGITTREGALVLKAGRP